MRKQFFAVATFTIGVMMAVAVNAAEFTNHKGTVNVPDGMNTNQVQQAIIKAAIGRRWNIEEKEDGLVVLRLVHRGYDATLNITYDDNEVQVYSDSWATKRNGDRKKRKDPEGWIENLKKDIGVFLAREAFLEP